MEGKVLIKIKDSSELNPTEKRLLSWIAITEEFGKPSDKYMDSFMYNFEALIENGNLYSYTKYNANFLNDLYNNQNIVYTGGMLFFNYLHTLKGQSKQEITDGILSWDMEKAREAEEANMRNKINDKLKHSILFELKGRSRGGWDALVQYLPEANKFILLEGSKLASECAMSCSDKLYGLLIAHQKAGNISPDPERKVLKNMTFTSASTVANLVALAQIGIHNYIAKGTTISLENMLANDELYNKVIDVQELNKVKELEDKENSQNIEEDIEKEMGKYDIKHSVTLHLYSDADSGRGYDARIKFNSITGNFIILRESRMALQPVPSCPETYINRAIELFKTGKVTKEGVILTDIAYTTLGAAGSLIALSVAFEDNIYIDGTDFKLIDVLDDVILYKELIIRE